MGRQRAHDFDNKSMGFKPDSCLHTNLANKALWLDVLWFQFKDNKYKFCPCKDENFNQCLECLSIRDDIMETQTKDLTFLCDIVDISLFEVYL